MYLPIGSNAVACVQETARLHFSVNLFPILCTAYSARISKIYLFFLPYSTVSLLNIPLLLAEVKMWDQTTLSLFRAETYHYITPYSPVKVI